MTPQEKHSQSPKEFFKEFLSKKKLLLTSERSRLVDIVFAQKRHFGIHDLYDICHAQKKKISLATIYRTLPLMEEAGMLRAVNLKSDNWLYENSYSKHHHEHMVCLGCDAIIEFENDEIEKLKEKICEQKGFHMVDHSLEIRGYCSKCQKSGKKS
jgi:Fur family transcriptional regulator, ferric uptake regulator